MNGKVRIQQSLIGENVSYSHFAVGVFVFCLFSVLIVSRRLWRGSSCLRGGRPDGHRISHEDVLSNDAGDLQTA